MRSPRTLARGAVRRLRRARRVARTAAHLSRHQWAALAQAGLWVPGTRVALAVFPWRRVSRWFEQAPLHPGPPDWVRARAIVWAVDAVARRALPRRPCLTQALVGRRALRRVGIETDLQIGAARSDDGTFGAHAWLEHGGSIVLGANGRISHYARFTTYGERAGALQTSTPSPVAARAQGG